MPAETWFFLVEEGPKFFREALGINEGVSTQPFYWPVLIHNRSVSGQVILNKGAYQTHILS